jgi:hypothetical protein
MSQITRRAYAEMFGPTTGDRVRLADTELWIQVEVALVLLLFVASALATRLCFRFVFLV